VTSQAEKNIKVCKRSCNSVRSDTIPAPKALNGKNEDVQNVKTNVSKHGMKYLLGITERSVVAPK
jgi:hypothetical protein